MSSPPEPSDQTNAHTKGVNSRGANSRATHGSDTEAQTTPDNPVISAGRFASDQTAATVIAYLLTGPALFGGLGWLADNWLGTGFIALIGVLAGMAMSLYVIWLRYGTQ